ncbi:hypothetical protein [Candidatus Uabimicrobium amorphum]|uniref:Uncharacterized protein n=1 Tax=Uabimicrobium amorphum TaxID=2596890 RepID=A0A5S9IQR3_UABAM|nr:hypothetical protein [Candidatus Uabimicrobium amorphum]BBM86363.1 hypothetical protein UABAM_04749 [Candidatus Uabimicrobium amorphum]
MKIIIFLLVAMSFIYCDEHTIFATVNHQSDNITFLDLKDPSNPTTISHESIESPTYIAYGDGIFIVISQNGLLAIDPNNTKDIIPIQNKHLSKPSSITFGGGYFVVNNFPNKNLVFIESKAPYKATSIPLKNTSVGAHIGDGVFAVSNGEKGVLLVDAKNPTNIKKIIPDVETSYSMAYGGGFLGISTQGYQKAGKPGTIILVDMKNPDKQPVIITDARASRPIRIAYGGGFFIVLNYWSNNFTLVDPQNPKNYFVSERNDEYFSFPSDAVFGDGVFAIHNVHNEYAVFVDPKNPQKLRAVWSGPIRQIEFGGNCFAMIHDSDVTYITLARSQGKSTSTVIDWNAEFLYDMTFSK